MAPHEDVDGREEAMRRLAEAAIGEPGEPTTEVIAALSPEETRRMLHELRVHQIELWMQNEELQRVQRELEANRLRYYDLYNHAPVGYCTLDGAGRILEGNLTLGRLLGVAPETLIGRAFAEFIHPDDQDTYYLYGKGLPGNGTPGVCEIRLLQKGDAPFWARVESARVPDGGDSLGTRLVLGDITARRQLELDKRMLDVRLQQAQTLESLGRLAGGVAHDMNNVLGAILGLSTACLEHPPEPAVARHAWETISKAALRGGKMVQGLLSFARQGAIEARELDVNLMLEDEVHLLERTALAKVRLRLELAPDLRSVSGDPVALARAVMNLCVNAVDATPEDGTLTLRTRNVDTDWVEIQVLDTGCGMSQEVQDHALEPFFTTKPEGRGTGLGLSMVHGIVQAHQGQLHIHSEVGSGTQVSIRLPALRSLAPHGAVRTATAGVEGAGGLQILVVDDDLLVLGAMESLLKVLGHVATGVTSGEEAVLRLESGLRPDLVILDLNMPGWGGAGTLPRLRQLMPDLPILLATGRADQFAMDLAASQPRVSLLAKPFSLADLKARLAVWAPA